MLTLDGHVALAQDWMAHPEHSPLDENGVPIVVAGGYCVGVQRSLWGIPSLGASALIAYRATPQPEIHLAETALDVPYGALCYGLHGEYGQPLYEFGHVWSAWTNAGALTTDYVKEGTLGVAPMALSRWTGVQTITWTTWTPFGRLPVGLTHRQVLEAAKHLSRHQLHVIHDVRAGKAGPHLVHVVHVWFTTGVWSE